MAPRFVPLTIPPGVSRPRTLYDARGRWYTTQLVRWFDGAMQPIGGWSQLQVTSVADVAAAVREDTSGGPSYVDETADANSAATGDVLLSAGTIDYFYIGGIVPFEGVTFTGVSAQTGSTTETWEYWDGTSWTQIPGTEAFGSTFLSSGTVEKTWTAPSDWAQTTVNSQGPFYYMRIAYGSYPTLSAAGDQINLGSGPLSLAAPIRGMKTWTSNAGGPRLAMGTHNGLYVLGDGDLIDITPGDLTDGDPDASQATANYGAGAYGFGAYGVGDSAQDNLIEAASWQLDNYGEDLVGVMTADKRVLYHDLSAGGAAAVLTNSPAADAVVVTPEYYIMALGAASNARYIQWPDFDDNTDWTPTATNTSRDHTLATNGKILAGRRGRGETLIWTTADLHSAQYIGGEFVYQFRRLGSGCGAASRRSMAVVDGLAIWMGPRSFFIYDGTVKPLPLEVSDYVFGDLNYTQISKAHAEIRSAYGEVVFYYPSSGSTECDRYVVFNYRKGVSYIGELPRTSGVDQEVFGYPISADPNGAVYEHETGSSYQDTGGTALTPSAESGPIDLMDGDQVTWVTNLLPDENTTGGVDISLITAFSPLGAETVHGPFTPASLINTRAQGRHFRVKLEHSTDGWRFGTLRAEIQPGGRR